MVRGHMVLHVLGPARTTAAPPATLRVPEVVHSPIPPTCFTDAQDTGSSSVAQYLDQSSEPGCKSLEAEVAEVSSSADANEKKGRKVILRNSV